jgi:hypothetical protein
MKNEFPKMVEEIQKLAKEAEKEIDVKLDIWQYLHAC